VEKQVLVHSGRCQVIDDGELVVENMTPEFKQGNMASLSLIVFKTGSSRVSGI